MGSMQRISFFLITLLFAGGTVFLAARDIRARLAPPTETERTKLTDILKHIQSEPSLPAYRAALDKGAMPSRKEGSYLVEEDINRIKIFLKGLIHSDESKESQ